MSKEDIEALWIPWIPGKVLDLGNGMSVGLVNVTPKVAANWLAHNRKVRPVWSPTAERYERDMLGGRWPFTGDPVRFSDQDEMLDGTHRCTAIEESGVPQELLVVSGLPTKTQAFMDGGRKRNAGHTLRSDETPYSTTVASVARLALLWNPGGIWVKDRGTELFGTLQLSTPELLEFADANPGIHEAARRGRVVANEVAGARPSVVGVAYLRASMLEDGVFPAAEWFMKLETGAGLSLGDPVLALRNGMMRMSAEKLANPQVPQLWKVVRAWNASRVGETMKNMVTPKNKMTNGSFPDMQ
jgi:hypothetical protein